MDKDACFDQKEFGLHMMMTQTKKAIPRNMNNWDIVEDGTQDTSTCAWEYRLQLGSRLLCLTLEWTLLDILLTRFTA